MGSPAYVVMNHDRPLAITVEEAARVLGIGRSTAYELVHSGDLKCIRLRRRIVVPVAHLAESLGVDRDAVWEVLATGANPPSDLGPITPPRPASARQSQEAFVERPALF
jgi:excisionase family DNA binding protein